jgi:hypothetical protein
MKKLTATLCLTISFLLGIVEMSTGNDAEKGFLHTRMVITQPLYEYGNLLPNKGMLMPSIIWV